MSEVQFSPVPSGNPFSISHLYGTVDDLGMFIESGSVDKHCSAPIWALC
jgi:hypothetical protein